MNDSANPFCERCGFRTYPQWGDHDCISPPDVPRLRHVAGDILSNLHFYRVPIELQIGALAEAFAWTFASNCKPDRIEVKMRKIFPDMLAMAKRQAGRDPRTDVQAINKRQRLRAKVKKIKKKVTRAKPQAQPRRTGGQKSLKRAARPRRRR